MLVLDVNFEVSKITMNTIYLHFHTYSWIYFVLKYSKATTGLIFCEEQNYFLSLESVSSFQEETVKNIKATKVQQDRVYSHASS